jgi:probable F420-dependent oxidoreductase
VRSIGTANAKMKFGLILPNYGGSIGARDLVDFSVAAEELGYDGVFATDHVIMPSDMPKPYGELYEPLVTLSFVGAKTEKIRLGTSILVVPQRNPVLIAKQVAALDQFSKGRVTLGVGAGWVEKEFKYLQAPFHNRGRVLDEAIRLMRDLWTKEVIDFAGKFFILRGAMFMPKPIQDPVPIWVGGASRRALTRAGKLGDGWHPVGIDVDALAAGVKTIESFGRHVTISLRITADMRRKREDVVGPGGERRVILSGTRDEMIKLLESYQEAGLEYPAVYFFHPDPAEILADVREFASGVMRSFV